MANKNGVFGCYDNRPEITKRTDKDVNFTNDVSSRSKINPLKGNTDNRYPSTGNTPIPSMFKAENPKKSDVGRMRSTGY